MFSNYLKTAWRNFYRSVSYSLINIIGLALGISCVLIITVYIINEYDFDRFHSKGDRIYRQINPGTEFDDPIQPGVFLTFQRDQISGIEDVTILKRENLVLRYGDTKLKNEIFISTDSSFFRIFDFGMISGDPIEILKRPNTVILTESTARRYFGDEDPIGKEILVENFYPVVVSGIMEDIPSGSFVHFSGILPLDYVMQSNKSALKNWYNSSYHFYCLLRPGVEVADIEQDLDECWARNVPDTNYRSTIRLQPLKRIHLHSENIRWEMEAQGSITVVRIFGVSAALILILACVNFINLSTARNMKRYREIGLRKVMGSTRGQIAMQFFTETAFYILLAFLLALALAEIFLPWFSVIYGYELSLETLARPVFLTSIVAFLGLLIILTGSYPSWILSSYQSGQVLKSLGDTVHRKGRKGLGIREILVIFQFIISVGLITGAWIVQQQFSYLSERNLGFEKSGKLVVENPWDENMNRRFDDIKMAVASMPGVNASTGTHNIPGRFENNYCGFLVKGHTVAENELSAAFISVENNFFDVMGARIHTGEDFPDDLPEVAKDSLDLCIINETMAGILRNQGIENPVGEYLTGFWDGIETRRIIGIADDIHYRSLHNRVYPAVFVVSKRPYPNYVLNMILDVDTKNLDKTLAAIEEVWDKSSPEWPFNSFFLDENFDRLYSKEQNLVKIMGVFTLLALAIALIGLIAIVMFTLRSRIREICIRKTLGADNLSLYRMILWSFLRLVLIAGIIALPLMYFLSAEWLSRFAYRIDIDVWIFIASGLLSVVLTIAAVSWQTLRAVQINPADALKYE
ncbi:MAG: ABC transporter permease [Bacteroidetes bacterium]|nr:ABC transporter permease [Bacteroidota bacterium]